VAANGRNVEGQMTAQNETVVPSRLGAGVGHSSKDARMNRPSRIFATLVLATGLAASASSASADYWDDVANSGRCVSGCDVTLPSQPADRGTTDAYGMDSTSAPSTLELNYQSFLEVVNEFQGVTPIVDRFRAMSTPSSLSEYDGRVAWFYESAYRENDHLIQALDRVRDLLAKERSALQEALAEADLHRRQIPGLKQKLDPIRDRFVAVNNENSRWIDIVDHARAAEKAFSASAYQARGDAIGIVQAVVPARLLRVTDAKIAAAESLAPQSRTRAPVDAGFAKAGPTADFAVDPPRWHPVDRTLPIDLTAPTSAKLDSLHSLVPRMRDTAHVLDEVFAGLKLVRGQASGALAERDRLASEATALEASIAAFTNLETTATNDLRQEKANFVIARDQMTLRAVQNWIWTRARDEIVVPKAKEFLIQNGFAAVAAKIRVDALMEGIQAARKLGWTTVTDIHGADEFIAVQQKVLGLLDPTRSSILQSAQFNALASPKEADRFSKDLFGKLGQDGEELMAAAGQVNVPAPYKGLVAKLLGGSRREAGE